MADSDSGSVDMAEVLAADLDNLSVFPSNAEDPYLAHDADACAAFDEVEMDDLSVRPTDALVVAAKSGEDASVLEVHLLEDNHDESDDEGAYKPHLYVHHDVVLPTLPLCTAVTTIERQGGRVNLVAVGCFTPGIDVWDVDLVNVLEPVAVLGGYESADDEIGETTGKAKKGKKSKAKARKKRPKLTLKDGSHSDAVMSLSWNSSQREYLASGSADATVKIWDIDSAHCARTFSHHSSKVQSVAWHPSDESSLLTGAFDGSAQIVDVRAAEKPAHTRFSVPCDVESVVWGTGCLEGRVVAALEDGSVSIFDVKRPGDPAVTFQAHEGAVSAFALSTEVDGLLVTGSVDKTVKVWDARPCAKQPDVAPELLYERPSKAGAVFSAMLCPTVGAPDTASPFVLAAAGAKGVLVVADLAVESATVRERFAGAMTPAAKIVIEKRAARVAAAIEKKSLYAVRGRASKGKMTDDERSSGSDSENGSESGSSGWEEDDGRDETEE